MMQPQSPMICLVENEKIMQIDYAGRPVKEIGVTMSQYQEALKVVAGYKEKLVEAGILKKEKTTQELHEEQMKAIQALLSKVDTLEKKVNEYEHRNDTAVTEEVVSSTEDK